MLQLEYIAARDALKNKISEVIQLHTRLFFFNNSNQLGNKLIKSTTRLKSNANSIETQKNHKLVFSFVIILTK